MLTAPISPCCSIRPYSESFGITKALEMGYVFLLLRLFYTLCQIPAATGFWTGLARVRTLPLLRSSAGPVATLFQGFATGLMSWIGLRAIAGIFEAPAFPTNNRMVTSWFPEHERASARWGFILPGGLSGLQLFPHAAADLDSGNAKLALGYLS